MALKFTSLYSFILPQRERETCECINCRKNEFESARFRLIRDIALIKNRYKKNPLVKLHLRHVKLSAHSMCTMQLCCWCGPMSFLSEGKEENRNLAQMLFAIKHTHGLYFALSANVTWSIHHAHRQQHEHINIDWNNQFKSAKSNSYSLLIRFNFDKWAL